MVRSVDRGGHVRLSDHRPIQRPGNVSVSHFLRGSTSAGALHLAIVTPVFGMLFMAVLAFFGLAPAAALRVDTADGGYTGIVVAIHESVQHHPYIVENIKALFRSASEFLHVATRGRLYFKEVTVVVPRTWPRRSRALVTGDSLFGTADVRAVDTGSDAGTIFTVQPRGCGQRGHYIQLTPGFLTDSGLSTVQHFGDHVRTLSSTGSSIRVSDGLRKAIEVLGSGNSAETGGMIVLASGVTEGQSYDDISGVVPWLEDNHVSVNMVVFGSGDSTMLSLLRERTRGMSHLVTGFAQETELEVQSGVEASLVGFLAARMDLQKQPIIVLNARKDFEDIIEVNFTLPSGTGKDTQVHILGTSLHSVIASLLNPHNDVCVGCADARDDDSSIDVRVPSAAM
ncbi:hypothetical protein HPB47_005718, partial [Ixodes persulcatus]